MERLNDSEINNICRRAANLSHDLLPGWGAVTDTLDSYLINIFKDLYLTGLRFMEIQNAEKWSVLPNDNLKCETLKGSNDREFAPSELTSYHASSVFALSAGYNMCRYGAANIYLKRVLSPYTLYIVNTSLTTHIFRHNKIKQLAVSGLTAAEIQEYIGEIDIKNVNHYLNSEIYID